MPIVTGQTGAAASSGVPADGWVSAVALTFASATTFTTATDTTAIFTPGTRVKLTNSGLKFFVVVSSSFSATTTVTVTGGTDYTLANAAISSPFYSYMANPQGWPGWFNYTPTLTGGTSPTTSARFCPIGRQVAVVFTVQFGTSNATSFTMTLPIISSSLGNSWDVIIRARDNGVNLLTPGLAELPAGAQTLLSLFKDTGFGSWTAAGLKIAEGQLVYEI